MLVAAGSLGVCCKPSPAHATMEEGPASVQWFCLRLACISPRFLLIVAGCFLVPAAYWLHMRRWLGGLFAFHNGSNVAISQTGVCMCTASQTALFNLNWRDGATDECHKKMALDGLVYQCH